jgi:hypothetical protein
MRRFAMTALCFGTLVGCASGAEPRPSAPVAPTAAAATTTPVERDQGTGLTAEVRAVLTTGDATAAVERERLVAAFRQAPPCTASWCSDAHATLQSWIVGAVAAVDGRASGAPIECTDAGCWTVIELSDPARMNDLSAAAQRVELERGWTGVVIRGGADLSRPGVLLSLWALARP